MARMQSFDLEAVVEQRLAERREEIRQQVLSEALHDILQDLGQRRSTVEEFVSMVKSASRDLWKYAGALPMVDVAATLVGSDSLEAENQRLKDELRDVIRGMRRRRTRKEENSFNQAKERVVTVLKNSEPLTIGMITKMAKIDKDLMKAVVRSLRKEEVLAAEGSRRSMKYSLQASN